MSYRLLKFTTTYSKFEKEYEKKVQKPKKTSFEQLYKIFSESYYGWSDWYAKYLRELGNDAWEVPATLKPLQKKWAQKNQVQFDPKKWKKKIALCQAKKYQPDIVFLQNLYFFDQEFRKSLRNAVGGNVVLVGWRSAPTSDFSKFKDIDLVLTSLPYFVDLMRKKGIKAELLYGGFEPSILEDSDVVSANRDIQFSFAGSLGSQYGAHEKRFAVISELLKRTPLHVWSGAKSNEEISYARYTKRWLKYYSNYALKKIRVPPKVRRSIPYIRQAERWTNPPRRTTLSKTYSDRLHSPVFGKNYFNILSKSKLTLNHHIDIAKEYAANNRLFEATGMGACLLTEDKVNIEKFFDKNKEVVTYSSIEDAKKKAKYLLKNENKRKSIAKKGQSRTIRDHTFKKRVKKLDYYIKKHFKL